MPAVGVVTAPQTLRDKSEFAYDSEVRVYSDVDISFSPIDEYFGSMEDGESHYRDIASLNTVNPDLLDRWGDSDNFLLSKFLGGLKNQKLTKILASQHKALHKELNAFLRRYGMAPSRANPGRAIRRDNSAGKIEKVLTDFYKGPGAKFKEAADDFFKYIENINK